MTNDWEADERVDRPRPPQLDDVIDRVLDEGVVIESEVQVSVVDIELLGVSSQVFVRGLDWDSDAARPALSGWLRNELRRIREREREQQGGGRVIGPSPQNAAGSQRPGQA